MTARRRLRATGLCALTSTLLLAACDDANPPSPVPSTPNPAKPVSLAPSSYLLRADQMPGYTRSSQTLSAGSLGDEQGDPSLKPTLEAQGMQYGARYTYSEPQNVRSLAFTQVVTEAILFNDATGAGQFLAGERVRRNVPPTNGGSVAPVTDFAATNADEVVGFSARPPAGDAATTVPPQTWLVVARRGRVVVELLGAGFAEQATRAQFDTLLSMQETLLLVPPGG